MTSPKLVNPFAVREPLFKITEHTVECQHIREWPRATASLQEEILRLAVKQYTPLNNPSAKPGDVTIIAMTANGTAREVYEPLWEDLLVACSKSGIGIRNIWIADMSHQGSSFLLNEKLIGNDPHWFDTSRDYLYMINQFRSQMIRPMVGIGHSLGSGQLVHLSSMHPRLLHSLVLIEPVFQARVFPAAEMLVNAATSRRDVWPSQEAAERSLRKNPVYRNWDGRALEKMIENTFRNLPTLLHDTSSQNQREGSENPPHGTYPAKDATPVTLVTPKHQEALSVMRSNVADVDVKVAATLEQKVTHPDVPIHIQRHIPGLYKSEAHWAFDALPALRPSVLYVYGAKSPASEKKDRIARIENTGNGYCGGGGARLGLVKEKVLAGGHYLPMENVQGCAETIENWLRRELVRWKDIENAVAKDFEGKTAAERQSFDVEYVKTVKALDLSAPLESRISKL